MAKTKPAEHEGPGTERWLITYADMITLLMAFFIMMYAMSVVNMGKFHQMAMSVRTGFGGEAASMGSSTVISVGESGGLLGVLPRNYYDLMDRIAGEIRMDVMARRAEWGGGEGEEEAPIEITVAPRGEKLTISLLESPLLFAKGSAALTPGARRLLHIIVPRLIKLPYRVYVEGHTCDLPISTLQYPSNWELSAARAMNVAVRMVHYEGFPAQRLSATPYGDTRPVVPNTGEANRRRNRRVDIVVDAASAHGLVPTALAAEPLPEVAPRLEQAAAAVPPEPDLGGEAVAGQYESGVTNFDLPAKDEPKDTVGDLDDGYRRRTRAAWGR